MVQLAHNCICTHADTTTLLLHGCLQCTLLSTRPHSPLLKLSPCLHCPCDRSVGRQYLGKRPLDTPLGYPCGAYAIHTGSPTQDNFPTGENRRAEVFLTTEYTVDCFHGYPHISTMEAPPPPPPRSARCKFPLAPRVFLPPTHACFGGVCQDAQIGVLQMLAVPPILHNYTDGSGTLLIAVSLSQCARRDFLAAHPNLMISFVARLQHLRLGVAGVRAKEHRANQRAKKRKNLTRFHLLIWPQSKLPFVLGR